MTSADTLVLTPTLGNRQSLENTILSVRLYGGLRVYHVLVGPLEKISRFQSKYPWIKICPQPNKRGVYPSLNHALRIYGQKFKYFAYINDDDSWSAGFSSLFRAMDSDPSVDLCYGRVVFVSGDRLARVGAFFPMHTCFSSLLKFNIPIFTQQAVLVRSNCVLLLNCFDESLPLSADTDLWSRVIKSGFSVKSIDAICASYQLDGARLSLDHRLLARDRQVQLTKASQPMKNPFDWLVLFAYRAFNLPLYLRRLLKSSLSVV